MAERNDFKEKLLTMQRDITRRMNHIGQDMRHEGLPFTTLCVQCAAALEHALHS